ncbi:FadR/GntR family transcriptional regulator [Bacillus norwichensis]|uniref:FadR family transcriptional regulator n=1 Tax=Bacillus norwichensis TaxID=2762217 RepID=A0ABR8VMH1_9BACI|nr:FadR/GntR family transcriptional regulator [Bacillus norwichensis]MBD8005971.1 FadR family transcriptional regulator [Bacillus norwichensis]
MNNLLYSDIVGEIEKKIMTDELKEDSKLPSERELAVHYDVSRNVVREALTELRVKGLVTIKPGKGVYVTKPNEDIVTESLHRVLHSNDVTLENILDVREKLEILIIEQAVEKASPSCLSELKKIYEQMEKNKYLVHKYIESDAEFHLNIAKATQNKALYVLIHSFFDLTERELFRITTYTPTSVHDAQRHHSLLVDAIETRNKALAISVIKEHMGLLREEIKMLREQGVLKEE